ncbi:hypothetical protein ACX93W_25085 [Paenibacillus sp. CAU 1782]
MALDVRLSLCKEALGVMQSLHRVEPDEGLGLFMAMQSVTRSLSKDAVGLLVTTNVGRLWVSNSQQSVQRTLTQNRPTLLLNRRPKHQLRKALAARKATCDHLRRMSAAGTLN